MPAAGAATIGRVRARLLTLLGALALVTGCGGGDGGSATGTAAAAEVAPASAVGYIAVNADLDSEQ